MKSLKTMFLGFLVMLVGMALIITVSSSVAASSPFLPDPLVSLFVPHSGSALADLERTLIVLRMEEGVALVVMLIGLGIAIVGYLRRE